MPPAYMLLICVLALAVAVVALVQVNRLSVRHEARDVLIEAIGRQLDEIRQDGKRNTDLLNTIIKGHVARGD